MSDKMYIDGQVVALTADNRTPYLYQNVRITAGRMPNLAAHLHYLHDWGAHLWGCTTTLDATEVRDAIRHLLLTNCYPAEAVCHAQVRLYTDGSLNIVLGELSPYATYSLRALHPTASVQMWITPTGTLCTRAFEAATDEALLAARRKDCTSALQQDDCSRLLTLDGSALFAVRGERIICPSTATDSVEIDITRKAAVAAHKSFERGDIFAEQLPQIDELFSVDYRGVTAVGECNGHVFSDIIAERIALSLRDFI